MSNAFNAEVVVVDDAFRYSKSYRVSYKGNVCVTSFSVDYNFERIFFWKKNCEGQGWVFFKKDFEIESKKENIPKRYPQGVIVRNHLGSRFQEIIPCLGVLCNHFGSDGFS